jgi:hypothetical protein
VIVPCFIAVPFLFQYSVHRRPVDLQRARSLGRPQPVNAVAYALLRARKIVSGLKAAGLTEEERYAVADHVVSQLKQHDDPWELSEEAKPGRGPTT